MRDYFEVRLGRRTVWVYVADWRDPGFGFSNGSRKSVSRTCRVPVLGLRYHVTRPA
jgi:hypothetical protein